MSQARNPKDTQALLQSMLQRLKLQPGREGQAIVHTPSPIRAASTWGQDGERGASGHHRVNSPVNGLELGTNGISPKEHEISAVDRNFDPKGQLQQPHLGPEVGKSVVSFHTQKDNIDGSMGVNRVSGQATPPGITMTGTKQLFPAKSLKDADIASSERTDGERVSFGSPAATTSPTSMGQNLDQNQRFTPRAYQWSLRTADAHLDTESQEGKVFHMGNGGFGSLAQSKDTQIVPDDHKTTNSNPMRKLRSPEVKTGRWAQRIKQRWRDRPGSLGKKTKEEDEKSEQGSELLGVESVLNTSTKAEETTIPSMDSSQIHPTYTEDGSREGQLRPFSDFEFGLGSFSLLEEIVTGQEWAKFLNLNPLLPSGNQRQSKEVKMPPNPPDSGVSPLNLDSRRGANDRWSFRGSESDFSMAQISPVALPADSMDVSEGKPQQYVHAEAQQSEPMEHGHSQSDMQAEESGQQHTPPSFSKPADMLRKSPALKSRLQITRKRQHQSAGRRIDRLQIGSISDGEEADKDTPMSTRSPTSSSVMQETGESKPGATMLVNLLNASASPRSPSSPSPLPPKPRGVLKHSISQDLESSIETKRRRVEENRRVRFSEMVVTIPPPEPAQYATDSEEDSEEDEEEEGSVIGENWMVGQAGVQIEEAAPARRSALPAWILALKRKNTGRKRR